MARPLVLIHGYSAEGKDFEKLKQALVGGTSIHAPAGQNETARRRAMGQITDRM